MGGQTQPRADTDVRQDAGLGYALLAGLDRHVHLAGSCGGRAVDVDVRQHARRRMQSRRLRNTLLALVLGLADWMLTNGNSTLVASCKRLRNGHLTCCRPATCRPAGIGSVCKATARLEIACRAVAAVTAMFGGYDYPFRVSYLGGTGNDVVLTAVPEPASLVLAALGLGLFAALGRRLRRRGKTAA